MSVEGENPRQLESYDCPTNTFSHIDDQIKWEDEGETTPRRARDAVVRREADTPATGLLLPPRSLPRRRVRLLSRPPPTRYRDRAALRAAASSSPRKRSNARRRRARSRAGAARVAARRDRAAELHKVHAIVSMPGVSDDEPRAAAPKDDAAGAAGVGLARAARAHTRPTCARASRRARSRPERLFERATATVTGGSRVRTSPLSRAVPPWPPDTAIDRIWRGVARGGVLRARVRLRDSVADCGEEGALLDDADDAAIGDGALSFDAFLVALDWHGVLEAREQEIREIGPRHADLDAYLRDIDWWKGWAGVEEHVPWRCRRRRGGQLDDDPEGACHALWCRPGR